MNDGRNKLHFRVGWAKQHLKKAGLVDSPQRAYY
ncbi:MAG: winged helix-turn-helix domain-containing protein [Ruminococcus sp.]|nr:winged helix-turn-helix domain-containing protein [Ruminococcus sp.]